MLKLHPVPLRSGQGGLVMRPVRGSHRRSRIQPHSFRFHFAFGVRIAQ